MKSEVISFSASSANHLPPSMRGSLKNSRTRALTISPPRVIKRFADDLVLQVQLQLAVLHHVE